MLKINPRPTSWVIALIGMGSAVWFRGDVLASQEHLNVLSYWGTVATLIALLLAISETAYSIQTTKSLQAQTAAALESVRRVEDASTISDCIAAIDVTHHAVLTERYDAALGAYQHFRKLCVRTIPSFHASPAQGPSALSDLGELELKLSSATRVNAGAGLSKPQKHDILKRLLLIKQAVEQHNPANRC